MYKFHVCDLEDNRNLKLIRCGLVGESSEKSESPQRKVRFALFAVFKTLEQTSFREISYLLKIT